MSQAVLDILQRIDQLPDSDRSFLESHFAKLAEAEWKRESELARTIASQKGIDQAVIDRAVESVRYGK